jgi:hypothetical protein
VVNAPFRQEQTPPWKRQHPVVAPLAANGVPHASRQAVPVAAVGVATVVPPQAVTVAAAAPHVSGITKVAVTFTSAVMETMQVPVPEQPPPDQPANADPSETVGVAVKVTLPLPLANSAEHVAPQVMPVGAELTIPVPPTLLLTVRACPAPHVPPALVPEPAVNVPLLHQHSPVPSRNQHPLAIPATAIAVSHWSWHAVLVSWPRSLAGRVPSVQPKASAIVVHPTCANVAFTVVAAAMDTVQVVPLLLVQPVHPANTDPSVVVAVAVRVTLIP